MHVIKTTLERSLKANTEDDEGFKQMDREATSVPRQKMNLIFKARGHKRWKVLFLGGSHDQSARDSSTVNWPPRGPSCSRYEQKSILELLTPGLAWVADRFVAVQTDLWDSFEE